MNNYSKIVFIIFLIVVSNNIIANTYNLKNKLDIVDDNYFIIIDSINNDVNNLELTKNISFREHVKGKGIKEVVT